MKYPLLIAAASWIFFAIAWSRWRVRAVGGESLPDSLRILLSVAILVTMGSAAFIMRGVQGPAAFGFGMVFSLGLYMAGFLALFVMWHQTIFALISRPITDAFDGGGATEEQRPFYFKALACKGRGEHMAAIEEIEDQLSRFPKDKEGWLLKAEIESNGLLQPIVALATLDEFLAIARPEDRPEALFRQAEIELDRMKRPEAARRRLEQITHEFQGTEAARLALQKIARLPSGGWSEGNPLGDRDALVVTQHEEKIGLSTDLGARHIPRGESPENLRDQLLLQLEQHPDDTVAREELARLLANELGEPDEAHRHLEDLVAAPGHPDRDVVRWLNIMADIHLRSPDGIAPASLALQRILHAFPGSPAADAAERRITLLRVESTSKPETPKVRIRRTTTNVGLATDRRFSARRANIPGLLPDPEVPDAPPSSADPSTP
jgi:tetratricopeptide (TPR) repeat protein